MKLLHCVPLCATIVCLSACGDTDSLGRGTDSISGAGAPPGQSPSVPDEVTLRMDPFVVQPGHEVFMCQTFSNPFGGNDVHLHEFESHLTPGSHHLVVNYARGALARDSQAAPCSGFDPPEGPFTTKSTDEVFTYHDGVAARLEGTQGLKLITHYINPTGNPLTADVRVTLRRVRPEAVRRVASLWAYSNIQIDVPPRQSATVQDGIAIPQGGDFDLLWILPHMHSRGTNFKLTADNGTVIYETNQWDAPSHKLVPPYRLNPLDVLTYSCTFVNNTSSWITFGESGTNDEMCAVVVHLAPSENVP